MLDFLKSPRFAVVSAVLLIALSAFFFTTAFANQDKFVEYDRCALKAYELWETHTPEDKKDEIFCDFIGFKDLDLCDKRINDLFVTEQLMPVARNFVYHVIVKPECGKMPHFE